MKSDTTDIFYRPSEVSASDHVGEVEKSSIPSIQSRNIDTVASNTAYFTETGYLDDKIHNISNTLLNSNFVPELSDDPFTQTQTGGNNSSYSFGTNNTFSDTSEFLTESIDNKSATDTDVFPLSLSSKALLSAITSNYHSIPNNEICTESTYNYDDFNTVSDMNNLSTNKLSTNNSNSNSSKKYKLISSNSYSNKNTSTNSYSNTNSNNSTN